MVVRLPLSDRLVTALNEERERVASGGVLTRAPDELRCVDRQDVGLGERDAVPGRHDDRGRKRRKGEVRGTEALTA